VNRQCDCVVCVLFNMFEVSFDVLRLGQRGVHLFYGFLPFWSHYLSTLCK
jgi:hypothetical protein